MQQAVQQCKVTIQSATGGTTSPAGGTSQTVECGKPLSISATANTGYKFGGWTRVSGSGSFAASANASTTFTPTTDATIKATFGQDELKVYYQFYTDTDWSASSSAGCRCIVARAYVLAPADKNYSFSVKYYVRDPKGQRPDGPWIFSGTISKGKTEYVNKSAWCPSRAQGDVCTAIEGRFLRYEE